METSCKYSPLLSKRMGIELFLKKDYRQMTGSFKERGARNALLLLSPEEKKNGVVAASAGNHALALAYHGKQLGIPVTCVMPHIAPLTKITMCQDLGARVVLHGAHILEARDKADEFAHDEVSAVFLLLSFAFVWSCVDDDHDLLWRRAWCTSTDLTTQTSLPAQAQWPSRC